MEYTCFIFVIFSLILSAKAGYYEDVLTLSNSCKEESKATTQELTAYKAALDPALATEAVKRHLKCFMEKRGYFKDGKFERAGFQQIIEKYPVPKETAALFLKVADICKDTKGSSDPDTAYKIVACFKDNKAPFGFIKNI